MAEYVKIYQYYYKQDRKNRTKSEYNEAEKIQKELDSFEDESDQYEYIRNRRQSSYNRNIDFILFGISENAEVDPLDLNFHNKNKYFKPQKDSNGNNIDYNSKKYRIREELYTKHDRHGNIKYNRHGVAKKYGKIGQAGINAAQNIQNSKIVKIIKFIATHAYEIFWTIVGISIAWAVITLIIYLAGIANSIGRSPFVICDSSETTKKTTISTTQAILENAEGINQALDPDYKFKIIIKKGLEKGWKSNAIQGLMSYIMGEAGTSFTYESYSTDWLCGPSQIGLEGTKEARKLDVTLNNDIWLEWMETVYKDSAHTNYYGPAGNSHYAACGLGLLQWSDVWEYDGSKGASNATNLINAATADGRYWQDTEWQVDYIFNTYCTSPGAWDDDGGSQGIDPTTSDLTVEEWSDRFTCGIGMPGWDHNTWDKTTTYYNNHHNYELASEKYEELADSDIEIAGLVQAEEKANVCYGANSVPIQATETLADVCLVFSTGDSLVKSDTLEDKNLDELVKLNSKLKSYVENFKGLNFLLTGVKKNDLTGKDLCKDYFSVAATIRASKVDPFFPVTSLKDQITYLTAYEEVTDSNDSTYQKKKADNWYYIGEYGAEGVECEPGDVLFTGDGTSDGDHIKIYLGQETIKAIYPYSSAVFYESHYKDSNVSTNYFPTLTVDNGSNTNGYKIYRCKDTK